MASPGAVDAPPGWQRVAYDGFDGATGRFSLGEGTTFPEIGTIAWDLSGAGYLRAAALDSAGFEPGSSLFGAWVNIDLDRLISGLGDAVYVAVVVEDVPADSGAFARCGLFVDVASHWYRIGVDGTNEAGVATAAVRMRPPEGEGVGSLIVPFTDIDGTVSGRNRLGVIFWGGSLTVLVNGEVFQQIAVDHPPPILRIGLSAEQQPDTECRFYDYEVWEP